jgi:ribosome-associated toxin RatA of RatAB toxin-antitoxin module
MCWTKLIWVFLLLAPAALWAEKLSPEQVTKLDSDEILVKFRRLKDSRAGLGKSAGVIHASPEEVWKIIVDVERYHEYMPRLVKSVITKKNADHYLFYYKIDMPWPLSDHWCVTKNWHEVDEKRKTYKRAWNLVSGTFSRNDGYWLIQPWKGGTSLAVYSAIIQPKVIAPQGIINYVTKKALPKAIENLRKRVKQLRR